MYSIKQIVKGLRNPHYIVTELNRIITHFRHRHRYNTDGIDVLSEDWDNLVILDACRYDEFKRVCNLSGELESRISRGANSQEFIRGNFTNTSNLDIVYVSANRFYSHLKDKIDAEIHQFIATELDTPVVSSSTAETVTDEALEANQKYPNKRLIVHYYQPHQPYYGPGNEDVEDHRDIYTTIEENELTDRDLRTAYRNNLKYVLEEVERLLEDLEGKTVITADHGELLGERESPIPMRGYGHPQGVFVEELVKVPWFICEHEGRKRIVAEDPKESATHEENVDETLRSLGYKV